MDRQLRAMITNEVHAALTTFIETCEEQYLTGKELSAVYQMFTPEWLKRYGHTLPRTQAVVTDAEGKEHRTGWAYPRRKIARMIADGSIERLSINPK